MATIGVQDATVVFPNATFVLEKKLGEGGFGEVWRAKVTEWNVDKECEAVQSARQDDSDTNTKFKAVKLVRSKDMQEAVLETQRLNRAIEAAKPTHVPQLFFWSEGLLHGDSVAPVLGICMELIDGVSVMDILQTGPFSSFVSMKILQDVLTALRRLHAVGVVHCDVKPDNLLVNLKGSVFLCDFGVSTFLEDYDEDEAMPVVGTATYMPPELFFPEKPRRFDGKFDLWSVGMTGFELAVGRNYWETRCKLRLSNYIIFGYLSQLEEISLDLIPDDDDYEGPNGRYAEMLSKLLAWFPKERPSVDTVLKSYPELNKADPLARTELAKRVADCRAARG